ncbi:unnamed protein product [Prorocentrum cordatum]|uniref:Uncharacterized protein n=1 Tax=Prorocentrum cordatum TaxID=2364126 RepID=A0ABN9S3A5_9DINO|nr:unnamed protein product [Polarella glacialis]
MNLLLFFERLPARSTWVREFEANLWPAHRFSSRMDGGHWVQEQEMDTAYHFAERLTADEGMGAFLSEKGLARKQCDNANGGLNDATAKKFEPLCQVGTVQFPEIPPSGLPVDVAVGPPAVDPRGRVGLARAGHDLLAQVGQEVAAPRWSSPGEPPAGPAAAELARAILSFRPWENPCPSVVADWAQKVLKKIAKGDFRFDGKVFRGASQVELSVA